MERDAGRLAEELRNLEPMQEKVVRLHYGSTVRTVLGWFSFYWWVRS